MSSELKSKEEKKNGAAVEPLVEAGTAYAPDTDIVEDEQGLKLILDIPGVSPGGVTVELDENFILSVKARNVFVEPAGNASRQFSIGDYYRVFQLGDVYDREKVNARLENGVLTLTIPKREDVKPKRIAIRA